MASRSRVALSRVAFAFAALVAMLGVARIAAASIPIVGSCLEASYLDRTATDADRELHWDYSFAGDAERCITIRAGQRVRWVGGFSGHPLAPDEGTRPTPIVEHAEETGAVELLFSQPGIYGYRCNYHFEMRGAIQVLPALAPTQVLAPGFVGKVSIDAAYLTGAPNATDIAFAGDGRAIVTLKEGTIVVRHADGSKANVAYPFPGPLDTAVEKGLLGVVADPNVAQNRTFYFYVSNGPATDRHRIYRAVLGASTDSFVVDTVPVLGASRGLGPGLQGDNHVGGGMVIYGGKLFLGVGDSGANASPPTNKYASCLDKGNGKVLRINLDGTVPADNPLVGVASVSACPSPTGAWTMAPPDTRIYAWGFRNPWRLWADAQTGRLWVGDVGEDTQEEIAVASAGQHHGYPFVEGSNVWGDVDGKNCSTLSPSRPCTAPAFSYDHSFGHAVTGGLVPQGRGWTKVFGGTSYVFGDSSSGWLRALPVNAARTGFSSPTHVELATGSSMPVSLRMGPDQSLYVVYSLDGSVQRFTPVDRTGGDCGVAVPSRSDASTAILAALLALVGLVGARALPRRTR